MATGVVIKNLSKSYNGGSPVLRDFSVEIKPGELFFLLGPSGCGKSTLLRILSGLITADSGEICFDGKEISNLPPEKRRAAMVFQNYALWPHLNVFENVAFGLRVAKKSKAEIRRIVEESLEVVRLSGYGERKITQLSGGQQQRVALARALAVEPPLILLDEPLSNLDARLRDTMRSEIRRICSERDLTAIYVTHDRQEALSMADRMAVMTNGKINQLGTPKELYDRPVDRFTATFLGDMNFIPGKVISSRQVETACGVFDVAVPETIASGSPVDLAIRPERISFSASGQVTAMLTGGSYLGESSEWTLQANGVPLLVRESAPPEREKGGSYPLTFDRDHLLVFPKQD